MLYSNSSSNQSNLSLVQRSPAWCGSTQTSAPSFTCQPGRTPFILKTCQPSKLLPLNSTFHPAFLSSSDSPLFSEALEAASFCSICCFHSSPSSWTVLPVSFFHSSSLYCPSRAAAFSRTIKSGSYL